MTDSTPAQPQFDPPPRNPIINRSKGTKLIVVCVLAVLMAIPALLVFGLLLERTHRADQVAQEIGGLMGGRQTFMGPVMRIPYVVPRREIIDDQGHKSTVDGAAGALIVFPATGKVDARTKSEVRSRSLFRVPVYTSDMAFTAHFDFASVATEAPTGAVLQWDKAELLAGASDSRGARSDITAHIGAKDAILSPAKFGQQAFTGTESYGQTTLDMFSAPVPDIGADKPVDVSVRMSFTGAQQIALLAFAKSTQATVSGDWNTPSFGGGFLPVTRALPRDKTVAPEKGAVPLKSGFSASWSIPFIARGLPAVTDASNFASLGKSAVSVTFVEPTNPYQSVGRSLKYALLFVGLVFLTYFVFESTSKKELHPAQYILVGLAQITFYLLLLSFAERIGFDAAFAVAATATVLLISGYAGLVFNSLWRFISALVAFTLLYGLIYILMRLEDYALLVGAVSAFIVIAAVMLLTRNINWYANRAE